MRMQRSDSLVSSVEMNTASTHAQAAAIDHPGSSESAAVNDHAASNIAIIPAITPCAACRRASRK